MAASNDIVHSAAQSVILDKIHNAYKVAIEWLKENPHQLQEVGILRLSGGASEVEGLCELFLADDFKSVPEGTNVHALMSALKKIIVNNESVLKGTPEVETGNISEVINHLVKFDVTNNVKKARIIYDLMYLGNLVAQNAADNKMPATNVVIALLGTKLLIFSTLSEAEQNLKALSKEYISVVVENLGRFNISFTEAYPRQSEILTLDADLENQLRERWNTLAAKQTLFAHTRAVEKVLGAQSPKVYESIGHALDVKGQRIAELDEGILHATNQVEALRAEQQKKNREELGIPGPRKRR